MLCLIVDATGPRVYHYLSVGSLFRGVIIIEGTHGRFRGFSRSEPYWMNARDVLSRLVQVR